MGITNALKNRSLLIHILCWGIVIFLPLLFYRPNDTWDMRLTHFVRSMGSTLCYAIVFYINYLWLIPKLYFGRKRKMFFLANLALIAIAIASTFGWWNLMNHIFDIAPRRRPGMGPSILSLIFQSLLMFILVVGLAVAIKMGQRWQHMEDARKEAERQRTEAELSNLRNQLNPHFLLNTLNNIYALIAFDQNKAQTAVEELSKLLRHVLYGNQLNFVPLYKEVAFINNYIELMKIRVTQNVKVNTHINVAPDDATPVAPLIFISLIENAFKHGISPAGEGEIDINIDNINGQITCHIVNTNHPKRDNDKSGSGIGLEQVSKRLELLYPGRHIWEKGLIDNDSKYYSKITLLNHET
ncbi:MAG: sensor histidine kinase [Muribaculaceae bacterium]|nr:sensor histidine kinase [Muribaculaceae bacterium]